MDKKPFGFFGCFLFVSLTGQAQTLSTDARSFASAQQQSTVAPLAILQAAAKPAELSPQLSTYAAIPSALLHHAENIQSLFQIAAYRAAQDEKENVFITSLHGKNHYQTNRTARYSGYASDYHGWLAGGRLLRVIGLDSTFTVTMAASQGKVSLAPKQHRAGEDNSFKSLGLNGLLTYEHENGLLVSLPFGYQRYKGTLQNFAYTQPTATPKAQIWHVGLETGWRLRWRHHTFTPLFGVLAQNFKLHNFPGRKDTTVSYEKRYIPQFSIGIKHDTRIDSLSIGQLSLSTALRYLKRTNSLPQVRISEGDKTTFLTTGKSKDSLQLQSEVALAITKNIEVTTQLFCQRRLQASGFNDWAFTGGVRIRF